MIPDHVRESLSCPGTAVVATRDSQLQPCLIRVFGINVHPNQTTATFYIYERRSEQIIANLENNGRIALTTAVPGSNESYQLKGKFLSWRRNNEQDNQFVDEYMARVYQCAEEWGIPKELLSTFNMGIYKPTIAITFDVEMVFGQAPHPETGKLIS